MNSIFTKQLTITAIVVFSFFFYFTERYYIAFDQQEKPCLYTTVFLVDTWAKADDFGRGDLMAYEYHMQNTLMPYGTVLVKRVASLPNSEFEFNAKRVTVGDKKFFADISSELNRLGVDMPESVKFETDEGEFFLVGETAYSYDSRYWGAAKQSNIVGKAYAIL
jgi:hypothetical protein